MSTITRYVLIDRDGFEGDHEYESYDEAKDDAHARDCGVIERTYVYDDSELVWPQQWPPGSLSVTVLGVTLTLVDDDPDTLADAIRDSDALTEIECPDDWYAADGVVAYVRDGQRMYGVYPDGTLTEATDLPELAVRVTLDSAGTLNTVGPVFAWDDIPFAGDSERYIIEADLTGWGQWTHRVRIVRQDTTGEDYFTNFTGVGYGWEDAR